jgi:hypothetical protein
MVQSYSFWGISKVEDIRKISFSLFIRKKRGFTFLDIAYDCSSIIRGTNVET